MGNLKKHTKPELTHYHEAVVRNFIKYYNDMLELTESDKEHELVLFLQYEADAKKVEVGVKKGSEFLFKNGAAFNDTFTSDRAFEHCYRLLVMEMCNFGVRYVLQQIEPDVYRD